MNLAEVPTRIAREGVAPELALKDVQDTGLTIVDASLEQAVLAARLPERSGLSLGDRFCIALGQQLGAPVVTSDRAWANLNLPVAVELIR